MSFWLSVCRSEITSFFNNFSVLFKAEKWIIFHYCSCPTARDSSAVYPALLYNNLEAVIHTLGMYFLSHTHAHLAWQFQDFTWTKLKPVVWLFKVNLSLPWGINHRAMRVYGIWVFWENCFTVHRCSTFLFACTRLYSSLCLSVGRSVITSLFSIVLYFCSRPC